MNKCQNIYYSITNTEGDSRYLVTYLETKFELYRETILTVATLKCMTGSVS